MVDDKISRNLNTLTELRELRKIWIFWLILWKLVPAKNIKKLPVTLAKLTDSPTLDFLAVFSPADHWSYSKVPTLPLLLLFMNILTKWYPWYSYSGARWLLLCKVLHWALCWILLVATKSVSQKVSNLVKNIFCYQWNSQYTTKLYRITFWLIKLAEQFSNPFWMSHCFWNTNENIPPLSIPFYGRLKYNTKGKNL